jgi:hypothetical protein
MVKDMVERDQKGREAMDVISKSEAPRSKSWESYWNWPKRDTAVPWKIL